MPGAQSCLILNKYAAKILLFVSGGKEASKMSQWTHFTEYISKSNR